MQEEGGGDGESDGNGGAVREGLFGRGQGAGNGDRSESEDEEGDRVREEARGFGGKIEAFGRSEGVRRRSAGSRDRRSELRS